MRNRAERLRLAVDVAGSDGFVGFLRAAARLVGGRRVRQVFGPEPAGRPRTRLGLGLGGDAHGVRPHIRDEADRSVRPHLDTFVELLGHRHRLLGREAELAAGVLLQRRGDERRRGIALALPARHRAHEEARAVQPGHQRPGGRLVGQRRLLAVHLAQRGGELRRLLGLQPGVERPVLDGDEGLDLALAIDDEPHRHRLHASGRQAAPDLVPQQRREAVAHQPVEHAARLLGVDLLDVDAARVLERRPHRALGDLVEGDAVDVLLRDRQLLGQVPADRLPFPVGVGGDVERVGLLGGLLEIVEHLLLGRRDHVLGLELLLGIHAELGLGQVAHVPHGGLDHILAVQVLRDRLHLGR